MPTADLNSFALPALKHTQLFFPSGDARAKQARAAEGSRVTRSEHFELFYSLKWHFLGFLGPFLLIPSGHSDQGDQK